MLYNATYRLQGSIHHGVVRIDVDRRAEGPHYRATLEDSPLRGTQGGWARTADEALDFLNLSLQAEGAGEICFTPGEAQAW
jgi:uncharacterized protein (DUF736 family)